MRVKIEYKDKNLEIVNIEQYNLQDYCRLLGQRTLSLLYQIEDLMQDKINFRDLRHYIFDLAGDVSRIPENLLDTEQNNKIKMKPPEKRFFNFFKRSE